MSVRDQFGTPRDGSGLNFITIGEGESKVLRLLPPMHSLREVGKWGAYHKQHYGYGVRDTKDTTKVRMRPFICVEEKNSEGLVTKSCPECLRVAEVVQKMTDEMAKESVRLQAKGITGDEAKKAAMEAVKADLTWLKAHNLDKKWWIPVMCEDNTFGILKVPHAAHKSIDKARAQMREEEKGDIFDIDAGAWVRITRTGTGRSTDYTATIVKEAIVTEGGIRATVTKKAPLSEDQLTRALELPDVMTDPRVVRRLSIEQIRMLVNGGGSPEEVESVLNLSQKATPTEQNKTLANTPKLPVETPKLPPEKLEPKLSPEDEEIAKMEAQLAARKAVAVAAKLASAAPKQATKPTPSAVDAGDASELDDEEFLARFPAP